MVTFLRILNLTHTHTHWNYDKKIILCIFLGGHTLILAHPYYNCRTHPESVNSYLMLFDDWPVCRIENFIVLALKQQVLGLNRLNHRQDAPHFATKE